MSETRRSQGRQYQNVTYISGNTVRYADAMPDNWEQQQQEQRQSREADLRRSRQQREHRANVRRNQNRALIMNRGYVAFLSFAVIVTCITAVGYIKLQSDITIHLDNIAALETTVNNLRADNDATYKRLATSVRVEEVRDRAINDLGMTFPREDQIVYYRINNTDYMTQYGEIPN
ncbi:MAG: hypothetical protein PUD20_04445 [bacterium]|nr:hypothetical protein [bacterium]